MTRMAASQPRTVMSGAALAAAAMAATLLTVLPAVALDASRTVCGVRTDLVQHLEKSFGETRASLMLDGVGNMVEMFGNAETGTWTITVTAPGGATCVLSAGSNWLYEAPRTKVAESAS
jgi:hypothetical protein